MSQIHSVISAGTAAAINTDTAISSGNAEADTSLAEILPENPQGEPVSIKEQMTQVEQRLQALLAKTSSKGVTGFTASLSETIKSEMNTSFKVGFWDKSGLLKAAQKCDEAAKNLTGLSLRDLMQNDLSDASFKTIQDYVMAQHNLYGVVNKLAGKQTVPSSFLNSLMQATQFRACEALNIAGSMQQLAGKISDMSREEIAAQLGALDPEQSVLQGMQIMSPTMHGHVLADELKENVAGLFAKIDDLEAQRGEVSLDAFKSSAQEITAELNTLKAKVDSLGAADESAQEGPKLEMDRSLHAVLKSYVERMDARLSAMGALDPKQQISTALADFAPKLPTHFRDMLFSHEENFSKKAALVERTFQKFNTKMEALQEKVKNGEYTAASLNTALTEALGLFEAPGVKDALWSVTVAAQRMVKPPKNGGGMGVALASEVHEKIENVFDKCRTFLPQQLAIMRALKDELIAMQTKLEGNSTTLRQDFLLDALEHNVNVNLLVEARLRNIPYEQLQVVAGEDILSESRVLGQGVANTVNLCSYRGADGENLKLVFKPENSARIGLSELLAGGLGYQNNTKVMQINIASCYSAESIGCESVIAQSKIGSFKGKMGLFMEAAPGVTFNAIAGNSFSALCGVNSQGQRFSYHDTCKLLNKKKLLPVMQANLMQELNKLEWADILSGQVDRHGDNYLVSIDADTGAVKVTGIDNDASFGSRKIGMNKIDLTGAKPKIVQKLQDANLPINEQNVVDTSRADDKQIEALREAFGFNQLLVPARIDKGTFDKLMAVDEEAYRQKLSACLDNDAVNAAVSRLQDAKQHAQKLALDGKVVADWSDPAVSAEMKAERKNMTGSKLAKFLRTGFYQRDFMAL